MKMLKIKNPFNQRMAFNEKSSRTREREKEKEKWKRARWKDLKTSMPWQRLKQNLLISRKKDFVALNSIKKSLINFSIWNDLIKKIKKR